MTTDAPVPTPSQPLPHALSLGGRLDVLDALRGVAVLGILLFNVALSQGTSSCPRSAPGCCIGGPAGGAWPETAEAARLPSGSSSPPASAPRIVDHMVLGHARPKLLRTYMPTLRLNEARDALQK